MAPVSEKYEYDYQKWWWYKIPNQTYVKSENNEIYVKYSNNTNKCRNGVKEFLKVDPCKVTVIWLSNCYDVKLKSYQ